MLNLHNRTWLVEIQTQPTNPSTEKLPHPTNCVCYAPKDIVLRYASRRNDTFESIPTDEDLRQQSLVPESSPDQTSLCSLMLADLISHRNRSMIDDAVCPINPMLNWPCANLARLTAWLVKADALPTRYVTKSLTRPLLYRAQSTEAVAASASPYNASSDDDYDGIDNDPTKTTTTLVTH